MKLEDFKKPKMVQHGEIQLSEWVINGEHYPTVKTYHNKQTNECFQLSEKHNKFHKTPTTKDTHVVSQYGAWEDLE